MGGFIKTIHVMVLLTLALHIMHAKGQVGPPCGGEMREGEEATITCSLMLEDDTVFEWRHYGMMAGVAGVAGVARDVEVARCETDTSKVAPWHACTITNKTFYEVAWSVADKHLETRLTLSNVKRGFNRWRCCRPEGGACGPDCDIEVYPKSCQQPTPGGLWKASCDGDWTVIQSHQKGDALFNHTMAAYRAGFGSLGGDHWLGLDAIHALCPPERPCQLRVELTYHGNYCHPNMRMCVPRTLDGRYSSLYGRFAVANHTDNFRLTIGEYRSAASTAGDAMFDRHTLSSSTKRKFNKNGKVFSTWETDTHCSTTYSQSGWWGSCGLCNLNGRWGAMLHMRGIYWYPVTYMDTAEASRMLVRPRR